MEEKEIIEGNKLIADFMDKKRRYESTEDVFVENLKYHSSWDWLMPVVEKIGAVELDDGKHGKNVDFQISTNDGTGWIFWLKNVPGDQNQPQSYPNEGTLIERTWMSTVEFIKWHNQQTLKQ